MMRDGFLKSGGEPEPESCQHTLPAGLQRLPDSVRCSQVSLVISSGCWLSPSVHDLALVGMLHRVVRLGTAAQAGDSDKQAATSHQLWAGDVHWPNRGAGPGLGATALVL